MSIVRCMENEPLAWHSNYKIGGPARFFCAAKSVEDIGSAIKKARADGFSVFVLGGGTNVVFPDEGFDGLVLKPEIVTLERVGDFMRAGAGVLMADLLNRAAAESLSGLEWAGGLPGTVGGAIRGNAGAFGGETKDSIAEVTSVAVASEALGRSHTGEVPHIITRTNKECEFDYRTSIFKEKNTSGLREIILEATFALTPGDAQVIRQGMEEKIAYRKGRHPMEYPNIGSMFKNIDVGKYPHLREGGFAHVVKHDPFPVMPVAYLIAQTDLPATKCGGAMISDKHPNFIVNLGGATAKDVRALADLVKKTLKEKFDVELEEEVLFL